MFKGDDITVDILVLGAGNNVALRDGMSYLIDMIGCRMVTEVSCKQNPDFVLAPYKLSDDNITSIQKLQGTADMIYTPDDFHAQDIDIMATQAHKYDADSSLSLEENIRGFFTLAFDHLAVHKESLQKVVQATKERGSLQRQIRQSTSYYGYPFDGRELLETIFSQFDAEKKKNRVTHSFLKKTIMRQGVSNMKEPVTNLKREEQRNCMSRSTTGGSGSSRKKDFLDEIAEKRHKTVDQLMYYEVTEALRMRREASI